MLNQFDFIFTGGGASGLSLLYHLGQAGLLGRTLLIDQAPKQRNDRTWCFWEYRPGPFEHVVAHAWDYLWLHAGSHAERVAIAPYRYKMIQGSDFYRFMEAWLAEQPGITRRYGRVEQIIDRGDGVTVQVDGEALHGRWAFNSIYTPGPRLPTYTYWLQHFKGWVITAPRPVFDPHAATFMDFRVEQGDEVRFVYVLPFDAHTALVEYTFFSAELVPQEVYETGLRRYLAERLKLSSYAIEHVEYGVIPMTDAPFARQPGPNICNIGTAGGMTKASTGYTFQRIQRHSAQIVQSLRSSGQPFARDPDLPRHALMDSVLLNVLDSGHERGKAFFERLFRENSPQQVLRFLDEESSLLEDLALMSTVNMPAFVRSTIDVAARRFYANLTGTAGHTPDGLIRLLSQGSV